MIQAYKPNYILHMNCYRCLKNIKCKDCSQSFNFTCSERDYLEHKNDNFCLPVRCKICRITLKKYSEIGNKGEYFIKVRETKLIQLNAMIKRRKKLQLIKSNNNSLKII